MSAEGLIENLLNTREVFPPPESVRAWAKIPDQDAWLAEISKDPIGFWRSAGERIAWETPPVTTLVGGLGDAKSFVGGRLNATVSCLDRHVATHPDATAYLFIREDGVEQRITYKELLAATNRFANALAADGVKQGDRVVIYMPLTIEGIVAMLACARLGAVHSVVYAGLGATALRDRVDDAGAEVVIGADITYRRGKEVDLKKILDDAVSQAARVRRVIVLRRAAEKAPLGPLERDFEEYDAGQSGQCIAGDEFPARFGQRLVFDPDSEHGVPVQPVLQRGYGRAAVRVCQCLRKCRHHRQAGLCLQFAQRRVRRLVSFVRGRHGLCFHRLQRHGLTGAAFGQYQLWAGRGQVTYSINNHFEKDIGRFTPDIEMGIGDTSALVEQRVLKSYVAVGPLAHFQAGTSVSLPWSLSFEADAYEELPLAKNIVYSTTGKGKKKVTTSTNEDPAEDDGFITSLDIPLSAHVTLSGFYDREPARPDDVGGFSFTFLLKPQGACG